MRLTTTNELLERLRAEEHAYLAEHFTSERPTTEAPGPAYVADDGTPLYPKHAVHCDRPEFLSRYDGPDPEQAFQDYREGIYGMCLKRPGPEAIAEKARCVERVEALLRSGQSEGLREAVDALDAVVAPFAPLDHLRLGARPSRWRLIEDVRALHLTEVASAA